MFQTPLMAKLGAAKIIKNLSLEHKRRIIWAGGLYVPEEIIYAAGFVPQRMMAFEKSTSKAELFLQTNVCDYLKRSLNQLLTEPFEKGMIIAHTCDAMVKFYDLAKHEIKGTKFYLMDLPKTLGADSIKYYRMQIQKLIEWFYDVFGISVKEKSIKAAMQIYNKNRELLREIYSFRKAKMPLLTGSEAIELVMSSMLMPKDINNEILERAIGIIRERCHSEEVNKPRVLLSGGPIYNLYIIKMIEKFGAHVVCEDCCIGHRYFANSSECSEDPLGELANRYLKEPRSPYLISGDRSDYLVGLIEEYAADRIIFYTEQFCDPHLHELRWLSRKFEEKNIKNIIIMGDRGAGEEGMLRTKIESFLEI